MILSVTPTNHCEKENRCKYCYLSQKTGEASFDQLYDKMTELIKAHKPEVVTFAYNKGYSEELFTALLKEAKKYAKVSVTMQPESTILLQDSFLYIDYAALSCNTSNFNEVDFYKSVNGLREKGLTKIGVNFLMEELPRLQDVISFFKKYQEYFEQFHFLVPKKYQIPYDLKDVILLIKVLKMMFPNKVFIDECLKTVITNTPCSRNGNLLSLNADASVTMCSFADHDDKEIIVEKCPYLLANG